MKNSLIPFALIFFLTLGAVSGQPERLDSSDSFGPLVFPLDCGGHYIGVYGLMKADETDLSERAVLNERVNRFIETGAMDRGELHVVQRMAGGYVQRFPGRAELMYLRLLNVEADIQYWLDEACLSFILNDVVVHSLTYGVIEAMRDQLEESNRIQKEESPFDLLRERGDYAMDSDFTEGQYERMHRYFLGYVYFVERVLRPWQASILGIGGAEVLLEGDLWRQDLRSTIGFRFYALERVDPTDLTQATWRSFEEADRRMRAIDQGPLEALIALVLINRQLHGMYGLWRELRDNLTEGETLGQYNGRAQNFVLRHLGIMNALLLPKEMLPIGGWPRQNQEAINGSILALHLKLRNLMVQLFAYTNASAFQESDWEAFFAACEEVRRHTLRSFGFVEPLRMQDPEDDGYESGEWDGDVIMEEVPVATYQYLHGSDDEDSEYSDDEGEIDYPDEDEGNRGYYDDDGMDYYHGDTVDLRDARGEQERFQVFGITGEDLNAAIQGVVQPFS